jgi:tRNA1(Val) A37 N6-methylase TrmN6
MDRATMTSPATGLSEKADVTEDAFLGGAIRLRQPASGYRAGVDAVLLAAAAPLAPGRSERVLDAGAGIGTVGLCVAARVPDSRVVLVERDPEFARLARENVALNAFGGRVSVLEADVCGRATDHEAAGLPAEMFDHTLANPPYHDVAGGTPARHRKAGAHAMSAGELDRWGRFLARMTRQGGTATVIHKAEALADIIAALAPRFGALKVLPIHARPAMPAIRVLIQGVRGSRAPLKLLAPFFLHGPVGHGFTQEADAVLKRGAALSLNC